MAEPVSRVSIRKPRWLTSLIWKVAPIQALGTICDVDQPTLRLVEEVTASRAPASVSHPIRDELFPKLDGALTINEVDKVIHDAGKALSWLGQAFYADRDGEQLIRDAAARVTPKMLDVQDELEQALGAAAGAIAARKAVVAHETLRRFFTVCLHAPRTAAVDRVEIPAAVVPPIEYMREVALRLALLVIAIEHFAANRNALLAPLADKAFETSQTFRRAAREIGIDLTPWLDAPAATRTKRIMEAAKSFWGSLNDEQRRAVDEAWGERVEFPPRWPVPSS